MYGRSGGLTGTWFQEAQDGELQVYGDGANHWATVHVEDLADAYVRAAERGVGGDVFLLADGSRAQVRDMVATAVQAAGGRARVTYVPPSEAPEAMRQFAESLAWDQAADASRARRLLGWVRVTGNANGGDVIPVSGDWADMRLNTINFRAEF